MDQIKNKIEEAYENRSLLTQSDYRNAVLQAVDMLDQARFAFEFCAIESCGKCTPCRIGAVRGVELADSLKDGEPGVGQIDLIRDLCETMKDGSLCALGGFTPYPVMSALRLFPEEFGAVREAAE